MRVPCDFDEVENLAAEDFLIDYLSIQRPVLVRNALQSPGWQKLTQRWSRESILKEMGDVEVSSGSIPYAHNFGLEVCAAGAADEITCVEACHMTDQLASRRDCALR